MCLPALGPKACGCLVESWAAFLSGRVGLGRDGMVQAYPAPYNICAASREAPQWRMC